MKRILKLMTLAAVFSVISISSCKKDSVPNGFTSLTSPITFTTPALTATQEADLMANQMYVNLHTVAFPGGEIRGQLIKQ